MLMVLELNHVLTFTTIHPIDPFFSRKSLLQLVNIFQIIHDVH